LINPMAIYNEIIDGVLNQIPGGRQMYNHISNRRSADAASVSRAVTDNAERNNRETSASNNERLPFNEMFQYYLSGGNVDGAMRQVIEAEIDSAAARHNIDPSLVRAVIRAESNYRHDAVSHAGAMGLMQLMPRTAESLGVTNPFDISQNIDGGTAYLRRMLDLFDQDLDLALAAYNAGQGNVRRHGGIPPFRETQNFIPRVRGFMEEYMQAQYRRALEDSRFN